MTQLKSDIVAINRPASEIFNFLSNFNNFGSLMPEQVSGWTSTEDECSFSISGMAKLGMKIKEKIPVSKIIVSSTAGGPFDFLMITDISDNGGSACKVGLSFEADLNPMMNMMISKPLTNFLNILVNRLKENMEKQA